MNSWQLMEALSKAQEEITDGDVDVHIDANGEIFGVEDARYDEELEAIIIETFPQ